MQTETIAATTARQHGPARARLPIANGRTRRDNPCAPGMASIRPRAGIADRKLKKPLISPRKRARSGKGFEDGAILFDRKALHAAKPARSCLTRNRQGFREITDPHSQHMNGDQFDWCHSCANVMFYLTLSSPIVRTHVQDIHNRLDQKAHMINLTSAPMTLQESQGFAADTFEPLGTRLKRLRKIKQLSQEDLAALLQVSRETVSRWESGAHNLTENHIKQLSKALGVAQTYLRYGGPGAPQTVQVRGHVGAGAHVSPFDDGPLEEIEAPYGTPADMIALVIRGDSMMPELSDGDYLLYRGHAQSPDALIGKRCIVQLEDGRLLVKRLRRANELGCYDLDSTNAATLENQRLQWVAKVEAVRYR
jgi:transcriptional regulator with XRE-family HTH domain